MYDVKNANFIDDKEKMRDFKRISKAEFLNSYSYLTPEEYENTKKIYLERNKDYVDSDKFEVSGYRLDKDNNVIFQYKEKK